MGQPIEGSNPALSATPREDAATAYRAFPCFLARAVLGGELAVPCTCNPLQQG